MKKGFNFEKNLPHQTQAVNSTVSVFADMRIVVPPVDKQNYVNPAFDLNDGRSYPRNLRTIMEDNQLEVKVSRNENMADIMMETGTGKTYTYTKTIFELNKAYGLFKFVVVVPTLSIKAGTIDFLKSDSSREHFKEQYGKTINLHVVESQKSGRSKKTFMPAAVVSFVSAGAFEKNQIQVLVINAGMINSETMKKSFDRGLFDTHTAPFAALAAIKPFMIIDEPHKFAQGNVTWSNILLMKPQFILRYGATFPSHVNLIYSLSAVDSFNRNLVKGVIGHITEFREGENAVVRFIDSDGVEAGFELVEGGQRKTVKVAKSESLALVHPAMTDLGIEKLNKSTVVLSNGIEMKKGDKINPYSYAQTLQEIMLERAIKAHFELEKKLLTREVKIKPLTLFFIDNIEEYRSSGGYLRKTVESLTKSVIERLLEGENNDFYRNYLEKSLTDISLTHAGYFSKDNTEKDEVIEQEINEILHDKQAMLDLGNPRRFIFSKWTLREGWDNPNVFQICKLRSSGSDISKLQEVGRGLRLPVNEYGNRVKDEQFYLNYFVDFTESDFVDQLVNEINDKSGAISIEDNPVELTGQMIKKICELYSEQFADKDALLDYLDSKGDIITRSNTFKEKGFEFIKQNFPLIFEGVHSNKIRRAVDAKKSVTVRTEKYSELKELWERLNEKVILQYKFEHEAAFKALFTEYLQQESVNFSATNISERKSALVIQNNRATVHEAESAFRHDTRVPVMRYSDFLKELSKALNVNIHTLHQSIAESGIDINLYLNQATIRLIRQSFNNFLMMNAIDKFSIEYKQVTSSIHPTKLTDENGNVLKEIAASDVGILFSEEDVAGSYLYDNLYYDSELERTNIRSEITEVVVFAKIPKNSIRIPVAGGMTYSPDFAYVLKFADGEQKLNFIVEAKNVARESGLRDEERVRIRHAKQFFNGMVDVEFRSQLSSKRIVDLIREIMGESVQT